MSNGRAMVLIDGVHKWVDSDFLRLIEGQDSRVEYLGGTKSGEEGCIEVIGENVYFSAFPDNDSGQTNLQAFIKPLSEKEKALVEAGVECSPKEVQELRSYWVL